MVSFRAEYKANGALNTIYLQIVYIIARIYSYYDMVQYHFQWFQYQGFRGLLLISWLIKSRSKSRNIKEVQTVLFLMNILQESSSHSNFCVAFTGEVTCSLKKICEKTSYCAYFRFRDQSAILKTAQFFYGSSH